MTLTYRTQSLQVKPGSVGRRQAPPPSLSLSWRLEVSVTVNVQSPEDHVDAGGDTGKSRGRTRGLQSFLLLPRHSPATGGSAFGAESTLFTARWLG